MRKTMESYGDDVESVQNFGLDTVTKLCEKLIAGGAPGLHFYTLNQATASVEILKRLRLA
jgi:methylenetetrahydrofolate reductase (NADPH)